MNGPAIRIYTGRSMSPLFRPGDVLHVKAKAFDQIRPGDVIVFGQARPTDDAGREVSLPSSPPRSNWPLAVAVDDHRIVHRVIALRPEGLVTRGDANPLPDEELVTPDRLEGLVIGLERGGRHLTVYGGHRSLAGAVIARIARPAWRRMRRIASLPYALIRSTGLAKCVWKPRLRTLSISTPQGPLVKTLCGDRTIARWWPNSGRFECRKPYDLVVSRPRTKG